jgi:choice-of-anchor A domain-containing protein
MTPGNDYNFDLFYNERHTIASDLAFATSLFLKCPHYDRCGVCKGDGSSCCICPSRSCQTSSCDYNTGNCTYSPIVCPSSGSACEVNSCNAATSSCMTSPVNCNDNNACTVDSCDSQNGCQHTPLDCDDGNPCTIDSCNPQTGCVNTNYCPSCNAPDQFFGPEASLFNMFSLGDFTCYNSDTQGRLAVGGNADIQSYSVGCQVFNSDPNSNCVDYNSVSCDSIGASEQFPDTLVVNGNLNALRVQLAAGNGVYGGNFNNDASDNAGNGCAFAQDQPVDFASSETTLKGISTVLSDLSVTGTTTLQWGSLTLTGTNNAQLEIFNVQSSDLCTSNNFVLNGIQDSATVIINVAGNNASPCGQFGMNYRSQQNPTGYLPSQVLFNFFQATSLNIVNIGWVGSVLAPWADVTNNGGGGSITGQVFVNSWNEGYNCIQIDYAPFHGCIPQ